MKTAALLLLFFAVSITPAYAAMQTVTLAVPDMNCAVCPITVKKALLKVKGVRSAQVQLDKKQATVKFDDAQTTVTALTQATTSAGYPSRVVAPQ